MIGRALALGLGILALSGPPPLRCQHPPLYLLDADGESVLASGGPVSPAQTCGMCHDVEFIAGHSYHAALGFDEQFEPGERPGYHPWDFSPGPFGRWDPLTYRWLTPAGDEARFDLGVADWVRTYGRRHVGGGPALYTREGGLLSELLPGEGLPVESMVLDSASGEPGPWDWRASGGVELNCLLCHLTEADNAARVRELEAGRFRWAATATLAAATGLAAPADSGWSWNPQAFLDEDGMVELALGQPEDANCAVCHTRVHLGEEPLSFRPDLDRRETATWGRITSPRRISESALNLAGRDSLDRPWSIHTERLLSCVNCHFAPNNPDFAAPGDSLAPDRDEFIQTPDHNFAKGWSAASHLADSLDGSMRRCEACHPAQEIAGKHFYFARHSRALSCEACHIPRVYYPPLMMVDWTVPDSSGGPGLIYRGVRGDPRQSTALIEGYRPLLAGRKLEPETREGPVRLFPHNLVASWYWVGGDPPRPVRRHDLRRALFPEDGSGGYRPELIRALDRDGDSRLDQAELRLDTPERVAAVRDLLERSGVETPRIAAEMQPYSIHHDEAGHPWAVRNCRECHHRDSRLGTPLLVAPYLPGGELPKPATPTNAVLPESFERDADGALYYRPRTAAANIYVLGHNRLFWIDGIGIALVLATLAAVAAHASLRYISYRRRKAREGE